jgi:hypothetical protein
MKHIKLEDGSIQFENGVIFSEDDQFQMSRLRQEVKDKEKFKEFFNAACKLKKAFDCNIGIITKID